MLDRLPAFLEPPDARMEIARLKEAQSAVGEALRSVEELALLNVGPDAEPVQVCQVLVGKIRDAGDISHVGIFLMDAATFDLKLALCAPDFVEERIAAEFEAQLQAGTVGWTVRERRLTAVPALTQGVNVPRGESIILLPICTPRQLWGVVLCFSPHPHEDLPQNMLRLLTIIANHIGMAVENSSLMGELSDQNRNLEKIVEERSAELIAKKQALEDAYNELRRVDAAKDDFISLVAHELRTPLTSILSFSEFLSEDGLSPEEVKEFAASIRREAQRLHRLVNDVLDLAKLEAGKMVYKYTEEDLNEVAAQCITIMSAAAQKRRITLRFDPASEPLRARLARDRIQQVILNMLSNAIKFSDDGGEVVIATRSDSADVGLTVRDSGVGIAARDIPKVFNKFEQIQEVKHHSEGTGFGMPIAKNIIEVGHQGTMWVESEGRSKGATFYFTIPRTPAGAPPVEGKT